MKNLLFMPFIFLIFISPLNSETREKKEYGKYDFYAKCLDDALPKTLNTGLVYECSLKANEKIAALIQEKILARNALVEEAIRNTEAGLPDGCGFIYNNASLDSEDTGCDYRDISIKKFVEMRRETLYQELQENGF